MAIKIILAFLGVVLLYLAFLYVKRRLRHSPAPPFIGRFLDSDLRRKFQPPDKLIERSGIKRGMTVLDLGCGSGAFTPFVARAVGAKGKVYAADIQPRMLEQIRRKLEGSEYKDITNIELKLASAYDLPFEDGTINLVYMVTVLPEIPDKGRALREIKRVLKAGGTLSVTEFLPDPDYVFRSKTIKTVEKEGFMLDASRGNLWNYTVKFKKPV